MPVALAPGMGLNAYFSAVVGYRGSGTVGHCIHPLAVLLTGAMAQMHRLAFLSPRCWGSGSLEEAFAAFWHILIGQDQRLAEGVLRLVSNGALL